MLGTDRALGAIGGVRLELDARDGTVRQFGGGDRLILEVIGLDAQSRWSGSDGSGLCPGDSAARDGAVLNVVRADRAVPVGGGMDELTALTALFASFGSVTAPLRITQQEAAL